MEVYVGSNPVIKHKIYWHHQIVDADNLPTVKVYDVTRDPAISPAINPNTLLTTLTSVKSEIDPGSYEVYLPQEFTNRNRELKLRWEMIVQGDGIFKEHQVFVVTPYVDLAQAVDMLGVSSDSSDPYYKSYEELMMAERYARKVIENYTGQFFYLYDDLHMVYGDGADSLRLPFKINTLHELYENDILLIDTINEINNWSYDTIISESQFGIRINKANMLDNTVYTANGMVPPSINDTSSGVFRSGSTYRVQGRYGWDAVPDDVEVATIELMKDYFSKDKLWRNKYIHSVQSFDWHFEYNTGAFIGTGNLYVDQLLLPYVLTQMVVI
jgi:hypothetical protein